MARDSCWRLREVTILAQDALRRVELRKTMHQIWGENRFNTVIAWFIKVMSCIQAGVYC